MRRALLKFLLLSFVAFNLDLPIQPQEIDTIYRLRVPSSDEYFQTTVRAYGDTNPRDRSSQLLLDTLALEMSLYLADVLPTDSDLLYEAYKATTNASFERMSETYIQLMHRFDFSSNGKTQRVWNENLVLLWLEENAVSLQQQTELVLTSGWRYSVIPHDFNADRLDEWVLYNEVNYIVIALDERDNYTAVSLPLFWLDETNVTYGGQYGEWKFEDINADGLPEWILVFGGWGSPEQNINYGKLIILGWENGALTSLLPYELRYAEFAGGGCGMPIPCDLPWEFYNADDDAALEIRFVVNDLSATECYPVGQYLLDWNGTKYLPLQPQLTGNCCQVCENDQPAFTSNDYQAAFEHRDYLSVLDIVDAGLARSEISTAHIPLLYYRALSAEALDRDAEALASYVTALNLLLDMIDLNAEYLDTASLPPEWAWFHLLMLHLEIEPPLKIPTFVAG